MKKILVVDDDPGQVRLLESILTKEGYQVRKTTEAADGLQIAMHDIPDLIILDVMMPVINGFNFCRLLKSEEKYRGIPIVLITGRDQLEDVHIGLEMGAEAYLTKPIDHGELLKTIKVALSMV